VLKREIYETAGVKEYWILDPQEQKATFLRNRRKKFREMEVEGTTFERTVLAGFRFDVRWLWSKRRPTAYRVLRDLLGE
jgi:Uma2 family endonuclease